MPEMRPCGRISIHRNGDERIFLLGSVEAVEGETESAAKFFGRHCRKPRAESIEPQCQMGSGGGGGAPSDTSWWPSSGFSSSSTVAPPTVQMFHTAQPLCVPSTAVEKPRKPRGKSVRSVDYPITFSPIRFPDEARLNPGIAIKSRKTEWNQVKPITI